MTGIELALTRGPAAALLCAAAACALAAPDTPPAGPAPAHGMATRAVAHYLDLERALQDALDHGDRAAVDRVLAADFDVRTAAGPDPVAGQAGLRAQPAARGGPRVVRDLAVREFDDLALVSFVLGPPLPGRRAHAGATLFVVDVWRRSTGTLQTRYLERPAQPPPLPDRPSGRQ